MRGFNCETNAWGPVMSCGFGQCINATCVCNPGFSADVSYTKYANCYLPQWFKHVQLAVELTFCIIVGLAGIRSLAKTRKAARNILISAIVSVSLVAIYVVSWYASGGTHNAPTMVFYLLSVQSAFGTVLYLLHSLMEPLYRAARKDPTHYRRVLIFVFCATTFLGFTFGGLALANADNWDVWSDWIQMGVANTLLVILFGFVTLTRDTKAMMDVIAELKSTVGSITTPASPRTTVDVMSNSAQSSASVRDGSSAGAAPTKGKSTQAPKNGIDAYVARITKMRKIILLVGPGLIVFIVFVLVAHFCLGSIPLNFLLYCVRFLFLYLALSLRLLTSTQRASNFKRCRSWRLPSYTLRTQRGAYRLRREKEKTGPRRNGRRPVRLREGKVLRRRPT